MTKDIIKKGFFKCNKGNPSSRRLVGIPAGFATIALCCYAVAKAVSNDIAHSYVLIASILICAAFTLVMLGLTTLESIVEIWKAFKSRSK